MLAVAGRCASNNTGGGGCFSGGVEDVRDPRGPGWTGLAVAAVLGGEDLRSIGGLSGAAAPSEAGQRQQQTHLVAGRGTAVYLGAWHGGAERAMGRQASLAGGVGEDPYAYRGPWTAMLTRTVAAVEHMIGW